MARFRKPLDKELIAYLADMLKELRGMAGAANLAFLQFLLDLAHEEARSQRPSAGSSTSRGYNNHRPKARSKDKH